MNQKRKLLFHSSIQIRPVQDQYSTKLGSTQDQYQNHILGRLRTNIKNIFKLNLGPTNLEQHGAPPESTFGYMLSIVLSHCSDKCLIMPVIRPVSLLSAL